MGPALFIFMEILLMSELEKKIGYMFKNKSLMTEALTHSSHANENRGKGGRSNERLEFLGDSILGMLVARRLFSRFPDMPEGKMTRLRAELVCEQSLVEVAQELKLGGYMRFGKGEELSGGRERPSIIADVVEAMLAAIYLDAGIEQAAKFVDEYILRPLDSEGENFTTDFKTALQEIIQQQQGVQPIEYRVVDESGPDHRKVFSVEVCLNGEIAGMGSGHTKKEAEQAAAKVALEGLKK